jgi:hypothetical protein
MSDMLLHGAKRKFWQRVKGMFGSSLIGYWPLWESSGTAAADVSGNGHNGVYATNTAINSKVSSVGKPCPDFSVNPGGVNLGGSAALRTAFSGDEGSFFVTCQLKDWFGATNEYLLRMGADAANYITLFRYQTSNYIKATRLVTGQSSVNPYAWMNPSEPVHLIVTWSLTEGLLKIRQNGVAAGYLGPAYESIAGNYVGTPATTTARLCANNATQYTLNGWAWDAGLLNRAITDAEALALSKLALPGLKTFTFIGDNVGTQTNQQRWPVLLSNEHQGGLWRRINHAIAWSKIEGSDAGNLMEQVAAAANDDADLIIISQGQSDDNDADHMAGIQATVEAAIDALRVSNAKAAIYVMGLMPQWTDTGGGTPIALDNIRTATAAACTAKGIPYWDAFTPNLITAAQTEDGKQPTSSPYGACGHEVIKDWVLARL